jgi:hypothetical protein
MRRILLVALFAVATAVGCGGASNGSSCTRNTDCASGNCVIRGGDAGICCVMGGCP